MKVLVILMELFSSIQTSYEDPEKNQKILHLASDLSFTEIQTRSNE